MKRFNSRKAFKKLRSESQRRKKVGAELARRKQEQWNAPLQRSNIILRLMNLIPREGVGTLDVGQATKLMIEYAQTLPEEWVKTRVRFASDRLVKLPSEGKFVMDADLKEILLNLLLLARAGNQAKVAEIFEEAMRGDPEDVDSFRHCLVDWLADKVVDALRPVPEELRPPGEKPEEEGPLDTSSTMPAKEEWIPASLAVERAEGKGFKITITWLTRDAPKHGVRIRDRQLPGRHRKEVELNSLALCLWKHGKLLERASPEEKTEEEKTINRRIQEENEKKRKNRSLD